VPWLALRKELAAIRRKFKPVYAKAQLPWKKTILNSNLKAVVSRYYTSEPD